jgi:hypothetical protein
MSHSLFTSTFPNLIDHVTCERTVLLDPAEGPAHSVQVFAACDSAALLPSSNAALKLTVKGILS